MNAEGTWKLRMITPMGVQTPTLKIAREGERYTGNMAGPMGTSNLEEVGLEGNSLAFSTEVMTPMGELRLKFKGTIEGDKITGQFQSPMGSSNFSGERA